MTKPPAIADCDYTWEDVRQVSEQRRATMAKPLLIQIYELGMTLVSEAEAEDEE